ncbi:MAG TPA: SPOR domain-containing protein [Azospirillaceae bacterium]|nr:SPOR domain-containing protein [Azospirillaceae bacterium]
MLAACAGTPVPTASIAEVGPMSTATAPAVQAAPPAAAATKNVVPVPAAKPAARKADSTPKPASVKAPAPARPTGGAVERVAVSAQEPEIVTASSRPSVNRLAVNPASVEFARVPASAVGAQLAAFFSKEEAAVGWAILVTEHPELTTKKPYLVETQKVADGAPFLRLLATGFGSDEEARQLCVAVRARGDDCMVVRK